MKIRGNWEEKKNRNLIKEKRRRSGLDGLTTLFKYLKLFAGKNIQTSPQLDNYQITLQAHSKFGNYTWKKKKWKLYKRRERVEDGLTTLFLYHICANKSEENRTVHHIKKRTEQSFFFGWFSHKKDSQYEKTYDWDLSWPNLCWRIPISKSHGWNWCHGLNW